MKSVLLFLAVVSFSFLGSAQSWTKLNSVPARLTFPVVDVIDGNIHVVGGGGVNGATDLHLRYTPSTDKWDTLKPVPYLAQQPGGGTINGKLHYFGGGYPNSGTRLDKHYVYDPSKDDWTKLPNVPIPRVIHKTAVLGDSIYVLSGQPDKKRVDVYNAVNNSWNQYNDLPDNNFWYAGITTHNNTIYRFGGGGSIAATDAAHKYDASKDAWSSLNTLPKTIHAPDAETLGDSIFITGGYTSGRYLSGVWIYDIAKNTYSQGPFLNTERSYHNMVRFGDCLYVIGGNNNSNPDSTAVSLLRYCRGEDFAKVDDHKLIETKINMSQSPTQIHIAATNTYNDVLEIEIKNILGITVYTGTSRLSDTQLENTKVLPTSGTYICYVRQRNHVSRMKIVHY